MQKQSNTLNFEGQNIYVGIDVHLKSWTVSILTEHLHHKTFVQPPSPEALSRSAPESGSPVLLSSRAFSQRELSVSL